MSPSNLERQFHEQMLGVYKRAKKEYRYNAIRFLEMVTERGGLRAAQDLLAAPVVPEGLMRLHELGALKVSMEALVLSEAWRGLFTDAELSEAKRRLDELGYVTEDPGTPSSPSRTRA